MNVQSTGMAPMSSRDSQRATADHRVMHHVMSCDPRVVIVGWHVMALGGAFTHVKLPQEVGQTEVKPTKFGILGEQESLIHFISV